MTATGGHVALDTNAYVEILRRGPREPGIRGAAQRVGTRFVLLMPVVAELLHGARTIEEERRIVSVLVDPIPVGRRIVATPADWIATGRHVAAMTRAGHDRTELGRRSFYLDVHIAQLCRARGITLLTDDADHERIRTHVGHRVAALPAAPSA